MEFALLHSPFLSASSSVPLAQALRARGATARVLCVEAAFDRNDVDYGSVAGAVADQLQAPCALVVHSGAGGLVSSVAARAGDVVRLVIFVDAILPHDGLSWFETAPEALAVRVRSLAANGRAAPWSAWFGGDTLRRLIPGETERRRLSADLPRIPMAFLEQPAPSAADREPSPLCAYLQLSDGYAQEAAQAAVLGWTIRRLDGDHLWWITHPAEVARAITSIAAPTA